MLSFTPTNTTCICSLSSPALGKRRRLNAAQGANAALEQSGAVDAVTMVEFVGESFAGTFSVASSMDSGEALQKVLIVIVMYSVVWVGGTLLVLSCIWRQQYNTRHDLEKKVNLEKRRKEALASKSKLAVREYLATYVGRFSPLPSVKSRG